MGVFNKKKRNVKKSKDKVKENLSKFLKEESLKIEETVDKPVEEQPVNEVVEIKEDYIEKTTEVSNETENVIDESIEEQPVNEVVKDKKTEKPVEDKNEEQSIDNDDENLKEEKIVLTGREYRYYLNTGKFPLKK